ncbi:MAG: glycosyltransferase [Gemmatimonadetes bacterium]|nr:glycosyltransferase [Gemmatimonadota bacterium]
MMLLASILIGTATLFLALPVLADLASLLRLPFARRPARPAASEPPSLLFLVPAHDEELLIGACLRSLRAMRYPRERLEVVVVADNCTDRTAEIVRSLGFRCLERSDRLNPGKPRAIAWALQQVALADYDAVSIVDADSLLDPGFAAALATAAPLRDKAVQCYNDVSNRTDSALTRMAYVFSAARFRFMNPLKQRVGLNSPFGNGLCIGAGVLERHGWTAFSICEDWELYAIYTRAGVRIENVPAARIFSQEAKSLRQSSSQRQRWTGGRMSIMLGQSGPLLRSTRIGIHQKLDLLAEITAQGPVVQAGAALVLSMLLLWLQPPGAPLLLAALAASVLRLAAYTILALRLDPEPGRALLAFLHLPFYMVWRIGVQLASMRLARGVGAWVRTARHAPAA